MASTETTTKEINEIIGMTLERLKQARKELACLDCKAEFMARDLETVTEVLRGKLKGNCTSGYFVVEPSQGPKRIDWPDTHDMNRILGERERLTSEIADLEEKARQMGHETA